MKARREFLVSIVLCRWSFCPHASGRSIDGAPRPPEWSLVSTARLQRGGQGYEEGPCCVFGLVACDDVDFDDGKLSKVTGSRVLPKPEVPRAGPAAVLCAPAVCREH